MTRSKFLPTIFLLACSGPPDSGAVESLECAAECYVNFCNTDSCRAQCDSAPLTVYESRECYAFLQLEMRNEGPFIDCSCTSQAVRREYRGVCRNVLDEHGSLGYLNAVCLE